MLVKKYSNRRLYDTESSAYITLEDLAAMIKKGGEPHVVDAKTGEDLTQATLTQIIMESRGASRLLPVPLLTQLIRMGDDALAEFLGRYVSSALELYLQAKHGAQTISPYAPLATLPFSATSALARLFGGALGWSDGAPPPPPHAQAAPSAEMAELRREMDELKASMRKRRK